MTRLERVVSLADIPLEAAIPVEVAGHPIALVRVGPTSVKAIYNVCSHQYYELAPEGWVGDNSIECALHGSTFDLDTGAPQTLPALDPIPVYRCLVRDGDVLVDISDQLNAAPIPHS